MYTEIAATTIHYTDGAVLFDVGLGKDVWIPRSNIENDEWPTIGETATISIKLWFAKDEGLI